jgi:hypothetical protein
MVVIGFVSFMHPPPHLPFREQPPAQLLLNTGRFMFPDALRFF